MSALGQAVNDYLALRRALGYKLEAHGRLLPQFAEFLEQREATVITHRAGARVRDPAGERSVVWWHQRLAIVAGFARYLQALRPAPRGPRRAICCRPSSAARSRTSTPRRRSKR